MGNLKQEPGTAAYDLRWLLGLVRLGFSHDERGAVAFGIVLVGLPVLAVYSFESLAFLLCLAAAFSLTRERLVTLKNIVGLSAAGRLFVLFTLCLIASAAWSPKPLASLIGAFRVAGMIGAGLTLIAAGLRLAPVQRRRLAWFTLGAIAAMLGIYGLELVTGGIIAAQVKELAASAEDLQVRDPAAARLIVLTPIARGVTVIAIIGVLCLHASAVLTRPFAARNFLLLAMAAVILLMPNDASKLALFASLVVYALALAWPQFMTVLVTAGTATVMITAPFFVLATRHALTLDHIAERISESAAHRVAIYRYVAEHVAARPWLGWGFDAARSLSAEAPRFTIAELGFDASLIPLHPHNAALQIWLDTGALGAVLVTALAVALGFRLFRTPWPNHAKAAILACWIATGIVASLSFSIWHFQWLAVIFFAAALSVGLGPLTNNR